MPNPNNEPSWWLVVFQITALLFVGFVGYTIRWLQEWRKRIYAHVDNWQFHMNKGHPCQDLKRVETLADADWVECRFTVKFFNTKKIAVGLHRPKVEFVERRWLRRRKILVARDILWVACAGGANGMPPTTYTELTLASRAWETPFTEFWFGWPGTHEEYAKVRPS